jgi:hypothetical protein
MRQPTKSRSFVQESEEHVVEALNWLATQLQWEYRLDALRRREGLEPVAAPEAIAKAA